MTARTKVNLIGPYHDTVSQGTFHLTVQRWPNDNVALTFRVPLEDLDNLPPMQVLGVLVDAIQGAMELGDTTP
jgi:hypothetical protein